MSAAIKNDHSGRNGGASPIDALNDTIGALEARLDELMASRTATPPPPAGDEPAVAASAQPAPDPVAQIRERQRRLDAFRQRTAQARRNALAPEPEPAVVPETPASAPTAEDIRVQPTSSADADSDLREVAQALIALRRELRTQLREDFGQDIARQMGGLRSELLHIRTLAERETMPEAVRVELALIGRRIETMAENGNAAAEVSPRLDALSERIDGLASEKAVRGLEERWTELRDLIAESAPGEVRDQLTSMERRLENLNATLAGLPNADWSRQIGDEVRTLTHAVEALLEHEAPAIDHSADFARLDGRFGDLTETLEAMKADAGQTHGLREEIALLSGRIEAFASDDAVTALAERLDQLSDQVSALGNGASSEITDELAGYLQDISRKIDRLAVPAEGSALDASLVERFEALVERAEARPVDADETQAGLKNLERHLQAITNRLDTPAATGSDDAMRALESQIANLSRLMNERGDNGLAVIEPRLSAIESHLSHSQHDIIEAASAAAERAVASFLESGIEDFEGGADEMGAMKGLADDLRSLNEMTRVSDERQARAFDAVHDTLVKIAERLEHLDRRQAAEKPAVAAVAMSSAAPDVSGPNDGDNVPAPQEPAEAAAAAGAPSLFGRLAQRVRPRPQPASSPRQEPESPRLARETLTPTPPIDPSDTLDPGAANEPLEPGSGTPDINRILQKVREQQTGEEDGERHERTEAERADFIAAARRAAQAAAADVENASKKREKVSGKKAVPDAPSRRRPILLAVGAVLLAVMSYPLAQQYLERSETAEAPEQIAAIAPQATAETPTAPVVTRETTRSEPTQAEPADIAATASTGAAELVSPATDERVTATFTSQQSPSHDDVGTTASITPDVDPAAPAEIVETTATSEDASSTGPAVEAAAVSAEPQNAEQAASIDDVAEADATPDAALLAAIDDIENAEIAPALVSAAREGDAKALFELGHLYGDGRGVETDPQAAARFYEAAAERDLAPAQYRFGNLNEKGIGVERDIEAAKRWYEAAATAGNVNAMHNLAVLHASGADGEADYAAAAEWFERAADHGVADSQFNLAVLYARGSGVEQDLARSYKWFAIAAEGGDTDAANKRDEVANAMDEEALDAARVEVELWQASPANQAANQVDIPEAWKLAETSTASIDREAAIRNIQSLLNEKGFDAGNPDGIMGERTVSAIRAFQEANELEATGQVDRDFVRALLKEQGAEG